MRKVIIVMLTLFVTMAWAGQAQAGPVTYEYWLEVGGATVQDLLNHQGYIDDLPSGSSTLFTLEGPRDWLDNYGARVACYIIPPVTGDYKLYIASDDASQLFLSTDDNPDNLSAEPVAQVVTYCAESPPSWTEFPGVQDSAPIHLIAQKAYYMEAFIKEAGGGDNFAVGWEGPGISLGVIGGVYLADEHPSGAQNMVPAHRQGGGDTEDVSVDAILSWEAPIDPNVVDPIYDVYLGTEPNLPGMTKIADATSETSVDPGGLAFETRYYWRIITRDAGRTDPNGGPLHLSSGRYKWFETELEVPNITRQPASVFVLPGETATFTVEAQSSSPMTYAWFEAGDPGTVIGTGATLVIENAQAEGSYYCEVTNDAGTSVSDTAQLALKQMIAYYPLDGDVNDASGNGPDGTTFGDVSYSDGMVGQAIGVNLEDQLNQYVSFGAVGISGATPRTISCWAKKAPIPVGDLPDWGNIFGFSGETASGNLSFDFNKRGGQTEYCIHVYGWEQNIAGISEDWQFLTATYDGTTIKWYHNGELVGQADRALNTSDILHLGKRFHSDQQWRGFVDDARVYNYALDAFQVAQLYVDVVTDAVICPESPAGDNNGDCQVNLADLALVAGNWMDCGRVPDCI